MCSSSSPRFHSKSFLFETCLLGSLFYSDRSVYIGRLSPLALEVEQSEIQEPIVFFFLHLSIDAPRMSDSSLANSGSRMWSQPACNGGPGSVTVDSDCAEIIVVRHGETAWNLDRRIQGHMDVELNEVGRQQATTVANHLSKEPNISAVYASDLKRAFETAKMIADSCGVAEVIRDLDLRERHVGDLQGLVFGEAAKINPKAYQALRSDRKDIEIPGGGESLDQLYQRCTSSLQRIGLKHKGERVVVVTHGGVIEALLQRAAPNENFHAKIPNTSISIFHLSGENDWAIEVWGDVSHLIEVGFLTSTVI